MTMSDQDLREPPGFQGGAPAGRILGHLSPDTTTETSLCVASKWLTRFQKHDSWHAVKKPPSCSLPHPYYSC